MVLTGIFSILPLVLQMDECVDILVNIVFTHIFFYFSVLEKWY